MARRTLGDVADTWKKFAAFGALAYFVYALLPYAYLGMRSASDASSDWAGRAQSLAISLMCAVIFYGMRTHPDLLESDSHIDWNIRFDFTARR